MRIGTGLIVAGLGAILRFAVEDNWDGVDLEAVGTILMVIGIVSFLTAVGLEFAKGKTAASISAARAGVPPDAPPPAATPGRPSASPPPAQ